MASHPRHPEGSRHPERSEGSGTGLTHWVKCHGWQVGAAGLLIGGLALSRGGAGALVPLVRFLVPLLALWLVFRFLRQRVGASMATALRSRFEAAMRQQQERQSKGPVIDLCPRCGSAVAPGHRCRS